MSQFLHRFLRAEEGSVFVLMAAGALMVIAATGVAVDMTRAQILQAKMSSALDAAGLAAGATANSGPANMTAQVWVQQQAQKYFDANFPSGYLASSAVTVTATLSDDKSTVTLTANTTQTTSFIAAVGVKNVAVNAASTITRASTGLELVLVLDNTGSMASPVNPNNSNVAKIDALKSAVTSSGGLLDILYGGKTSIPDLWIGVVPFTDMVNIGTAHASWMDSTYDGTLDFGSVVANPCPNYTGTSPSTSGTSRSNPSRCSYKLTGAAQPNWGLTQWAGCATSRSASATSPTDATLTLDDSDDYPAGSSTYFDAFYYPSTDTTLSSNSCTSGSNPWRCWSSSNGKTTTMYYSVDATSGPNLGCIATPVLGMTATKANVVNNVNSMVANGSTMINLGLGWGYRMLSPSWQGHWGGEMDDTGDPDFPKLPLSYNTPLMNKVVILMTDGMNSTASNSAYIGQTTPSNTTLDSKTASICAAMKKHGIIIYTIGFGTNDNNDPNDPTSVNGALLKGCATDDQHYFLAPTNADLSQAFSNIGDSLANLRVSQ